MTRKKKPSAKNPFYIPVLPLNLQILSTPEPLPTKNTPSREHQDVPEKRLLWAVLERAIHDVVDKFDTTDDLRSEAVHWLTSTDNNKFSFNWISEWLSIPTSYRDRLRSLVHCDRAQLRTLTVSPEMRKRWG